MYFRRSAGVGCLGAIPGCAVGSEQTVIVIGGCVIQPITHCPGENLNGAQLSGADLHSYMPNANLNRANLRGAKPSNADLSGDLRI